MHGRVSALGILKFDVSKSLGLACGVIASNSDTSFDNLAARNKGIVYGGLVGIVREIPHKDNATIVRLIARFASSGIGLHRGRCGARPRSIWLLDCDVSFVNHNSTNTNLQGRYRVVILVIIVIVIVIVIANILMIMNSMGKHNHNDIISNKQYPSLLANGHLRLVAKCLSGKDKGGPSKGGFLDNRLFS